MRCCIISAEVGMSIYTKIQIRPSQFPDAKNWTKETFGKPMGDKGKTGAWSWKDTQWYCRSYAKVANFWFKDPAHAMMFILKWK
jgi:hypothetical protein